MLLPWTKQIANTGAAYASGAIVAADGDVTVQASDSISIDYGGGSIPVNGAYNVSIARFNASGDFVWSKGFPNAEYASPATIVDDGAGNVFLLGVFQSGGQQDFGGPPLQPCTGGAMYAAKFDVSGNHVWSNVFGCGTDATSGAADSNHDLVLAGCGGGVDFGSGMLASGGPLIAKLDPSGNGIWGYDYGVSGGGSECAAGVVVDVSGNVIATGNGYGTVDFGGGPISSVGGNTANDDSWLVKLDKKGKYLWARAFQSEPNQSGPQTSALATDSQEAIIIDANCIGDCDFGGGPLTGPAPQGGLVLAKYDASGNHLWSKIFVGSVSGGVSPGTSIAITDGDEIAVFGFFQGSIDFGGGLLTAATKWQAGFVSIFDASGNLVSSRMVTGTGDVDGSAIVAKTPGNILLFGDFNQTIVFDSWLGSAQYPSAGGTDLFLANFNP